MHIHAEISSNTEKSEVRSKFKKCQISWKYLQNIIKSTINDLANIFPKLYVVTYNPGHMYVIACNITYIFTCHCM